MAMLNNQMVHSYTAMGYMAHLQRIFPSKMMIVMLVAGECFFGLHLDELEILLIKNGLYWGHEASYYE